MVCESRKTNLDYNLNTKIKVYLEDNDYYHYKDAFDKKFFRFVNVFREADLICFVGGEDVSPNLYSEKPHDSTSSNIIRDINNLQLFNRSLHNNQKMVGICRGSQFLCVANGGKLIQDVDNHAISGEHEIFVEDFYSYKKIKKINVTSTHHQMSFPWDLDKDDFKVVGWSQNIVNSYKGVPSYMKWDSAVEPEVIYYPKTRCLGFQGHPEYVENTHEFWKYFNDAILNYLFKIKRN